MEMKDLLRMNIRLHVAVIAISLMTGAFVDAARPPKPNVVLLLTDDLGWQDVKCYDIDDPSPMETPNIDALSKKGVMFWQAYSPAPTCAPSRCAIMSGNHPARAQKTHVVGGAPPSPYKKSTFRMMPPWYSGRMPENELTLARVLQQNGYATGHCGKWHMAIDHNAFPQPIDQGFDWSRHSRGITERMSPHRLTGFATTASDDPFRLDENGYPYDQNNEDALEFVHDHKGKAFFLYYATWLVHTPIHTRSRQNLEKYCEKLGVDFPSDPTKWELDGQQNPFYCSMVEELDYHVGRLFDYLDNTDDPRWPGHKLSENTYLIFTSDNGGMERHPGEIITDNYPLDRGKISAREGGTRVPLIVTGPEIPANVKSDVMVNGLDFYPTILSLCGVDRPIGKHLDGCDLSTLLRSDPRDPALVKETDGSVRDSLLWHFPHSVAMESTIRIGDFKLIRKYDHINNPNVKSELELFRLYNSDDGVQARSDIEESKNLADSMSGKAKQMNDRLTELLAEMNASSPYYNPEYFQPLPHKENACTVVSNDQNGSTVEVSYQENGAKVVRANLIYTPSGGKRYEEWFRTPAILLPGLKASAELPVGTTHYFFNLIDENNFLRSFPEAIDVTGQQRGKKSYSQNALVNKNIKAVAAPQTNRQRAFFRWDTNHDKSLSLDEYKSGLKGESNHQKRFNNFDVNRDGKLTPDEFK